MKPTCIAILLFALADPPLADLPIYTLVAKDGRLTPAVLDVPAGQRFKIVIRNDGRIVAR
ncbi:MAG: cupredoxin domain-containing protein [Gallionellaceae bacterium]|nr:cupredoxin domain-containing protein [Gallionellaceae bacterium]